MNPVEAIGAIVALGLMGGGFKLYQMNRKKSMKIEQPPSPRIIDETPKPEPKPEVVEPVPIAAPAKLEKKTTPQKRKKRKSAHASKRRNRK